jgi:PadR family transcriptional regulator, regulatory protein PadR
MRDPIAREFLLAFWKIHILHHAADGRGVYGQWMLEELHHHGYRLSPGTLYPILARMAERGWLRAEEPRRSKAARVYRLTPRGHGVLDQLRHALDELYGEVGPSSAPGLKASARRENRRSHRRPRGAAGRDVGR